MDWFDKWLSKKMRRAWDAAAEESKEANAISEHRLHRGMAIGSRSSSFDHAASKLDSMGMRFHLYKAVGGHILETHVYDRRDETTEHTLYMISDDGDFAKQVADAILMEAMKQ